MEFENQRGETFLTKVEEICRIYTKKFNRNNARIDTKEFIENFEIIMDIKPVEIKGHLYYKFKHKDSTLFETVFDDQIKINASKEDSFAYEDTFNSISARNTPKAGSSSRRSKK